MVKLIINLNEKLIISLKACNELLNDYKDKNYKNIDFKDFFNELYKNYVYIFHINIQLINFVWNKFGG